jgi:glycosyltransferase involved in cell wall biosynthesis
MSSTPFRVLVHPADLSAGAYYRSVGPAVALRSSGRAMALASHRYLSDDQLQALRPDVVVFQRQIEMEQLKAMSRYRKVLGFKPTFLYEIDDLLWDVPVANPAHAAIPKKIKSIIRDAVNICDEVVASTEPMASAMRSFITPSKIRIAPNLMPMAFIQKAAEGRANSQFQSDKIRIGWAGGSSHAADLMILTEIVHELKDRYQFVFMGMMPPGITPNDVEFHPSVKLEDYSSGIGQLNLDIALAPLEDHHFNACKSNLRLLEYAACSYPVIASDIHPYRSSPGAITVFNTKKEWTDAIHMLAAKPALREQLSTDGRQWLEHYILENNLDYWSRGWMPKRGESFFVPGLIPPQPITITVGTAVNGYEYADTVEEAQKNYPGCNILYAREGAKVSRHQIYRMEAALGEHASVSVFNNEGVFPVSGQFVNLSQELADKIDAAANDANPPLTQAPYPQGPAILLSGAAISRVGLPDTQRFSDLESALVDWGARAVELGGTHAMAANVYVLATKQLPRDQEVLRGLMDHVIAWMSFFGPMISGFASTDPLKSGRGEIELAFNRINYVGPVDKEPHEGELKRVLMINGTQADALTFYKEGELAFCTILDGHRMSVSFPAMPSVAPVDVRETVADLVELCQKLNVKKVVFRGIGNGTIGVVGYLAAARAEGLEVEYRPDGMTVSMYDEADPNGYVDSAGWAATWDKLLAKTHAV